MCPPRRYKCHGHSQMYPSYYPNDEGSVKGARIFTQIKQAQSDVRLLLLKLCGHSWLCPYFYPNNSDPVGLARILGYMTWARSHVPA